MKKINSIIILMIILTLRGFSSETFELKSDLTAEDEKKIQKILENKYEGKLSKEDQKEINDEEKNLRWVYVSNEYYCAIFKLDCKDYKLFETEMLPAITYEVGVIEYIYELKESNTKEEKRKIEKQLLIAKEPFVYKDMYRDEILSMESKSMNNIEINKNMREKIVKVKSTMNEAEYERMIATYNFKDGGIAYKYHEIENSIKILGLLKIENPSEKERQDMSIKIVEKGQEAIRETSMSDEEEKEYLEVKRKMIANFYLNKYISEEVQAPTLEEIKTYRKK